MKLFAGGPPYVPKWIYETPKDAPSPQELQKRQEELADQVIPLWDAACERLQKIIAYDDSREHCSIE